MMEKNRYKILLWAVFLCLFLLAFPMVSYASDTAAAPPPSPKEASSTRNISPMVDPGKDGAGSQKIEEKTKGSGAGSSEDPVRSKSDQKVYERVVWQADDCGCTPIQPKGEDGGIITYGMYHNGLELEVVEDKNTGKSIGIAKIKFSRLNRIGYNALIYDARSKFLNYEDWENNTYVRTARQYNSRVDMVVAFNESASLLFSRRDLTKELARQIIGLIKENGGSGVTIDLRETSELDLDQLSYFIRDLSARLKGLDKDAFLNLMTGFDPDGKTKPFDTLSIDEVADIVRPENVYVVDLFLVSLGSSEMKSPELYDLFLTLSDLFDRYGLQKNNIEFKNRTLPILPFLKKEGLNANRELFNQMLTVGYGGVGLQPLKSLGNQETEFIAQILSSHSRNKDMDGVKKIFKTLCPSCCKWICPYRRYLVIPAYMLGLILIFYYIASFFICELRTFASAHARYFLGASLFLLALVTGIILCVPFWQGMRNMAFTLLLLIIAAYVVSEFIERRRQARYP